MGVLGSSLGIWGFGLGLEFQSSGSGALGFLGSVRCGSGDATLSPRQSVGIRLRVDVAPGILFRTLEVMFLLRLPAELA